MPQKLTLACFMPHIGTMYLIGLHALSSVSTAVALIRLRCLPLGHACVRGQYLERARQMLGCVWLAAPKRNLPN